MAELFTNVEVNLEPRWPMLLRLIGGSVALHLALVASVLYVPTLRDAFNIAALAGKTNYVDRPYSKTLIGEDVQMVEAGQKFRYPEGYFASEFAPAPTPGSLAPQIIAAPTPPKPASTPFPIPSPVPSPSTSASASPAVASSGGNKTTPVPAPEKTASPSKNDSAADAKKAGDDDVLGIKADEINMRPLKDWLARANALKEKGVLDLNADMEMTIEAQLNADCNLNDPKVVQKSGDHQLIEVAKDLAAAISESRTLLYLRDPGKMQSDKTAKSLRCDPMPLRFTVKLDQTDFNATVETEADSSDRAAQLSRSYNMLLAGGEVNAHIKKKDEEVIFKNTKVTAAGKQIVVHFKMPRTTAGEMLKKQVDPKPAG